MADSSEVAFWLRLVTPSSEKDDLTNISTDQVVSISETLIVDTTDSPTVVSVLYSLTAVTTLRSDLPLNKFLKMDKSPLYLYMGRVAVALVLHFYLLQQTLFSSSDLPCASV